MAGTTTRRRDRVRRKGDEPRRRHRTSEPRQERMFTADTPVSELRSWLARVDDRFMGTPLDVHPHEAILHAMRLSAGEVAYCDAQIARLTEEELFENPTKETWVQLPSGDLVPIEVKRDAEVVSRWVTLRDNAADKMAKYAEMAIRVGVEERKIKLAEQEANLVSRYFEAVLGELNLTPQQFKRVGPAMRRHLSLVEGTIAA